MAQRAIEDTRRHPRLRARCRAIVRDRYGAWEAETEDLGPRGCRILTPRPQTVGALVGLTIESDALPEPLDVTGQVVWCDRERPARAGISFTGAASRPGAAAPAGWFAALAAAERAREAAPEAVPPAGAGGLELVVDADPEPAAELARRLVARARELLDAGEPSRAALILRRALALVPGDAAAEGLLRRAASPGK